MSGAPALAPGVPPGLLAGERRAVARAISQIEHGAAGAEALAAALAPHLGRAHVLGITGAPGAGKSTLVHALLGEMLARGRRIAVLAVDPSSPITGGAVLGDRVRMAEHGAHPNVFIRSVASRGHPGGLSRTTSEIVDVLDAAGFDTVIVETVGAGQSEVEIMRVADTRIVTCPPGLGDAVQAIKAGILEIADVLVVTKSDLPGAEATAQDLKEMLHLRSAPADGEWTVPVLRTTASSGAGVPELVDRVDEHRGAVGLGRRLDGRVDARLDTRRDARPGARPTPPADKAIHDAGAHVMRLAAADPFVRSLGITCTEAGAGAATVTMTLRDDHINFHGTCHGGVTFALADTAFGLAANSYGPTAPGIDAHITYHQAARAGDTLIARALEISRSRRLAVYRVDVRRGDGQTIASFTGTVYITDSDRSGVSP